MHLSTWYSLQMHVIKRALPLMYFEGVELISHYHVGGVFNMQNVLMQCIETRRLSRRKVFLESDTDWG